MNTITPLSRQRFFTDYQGLTSIYLDKDAIESLSIDWSRWLGSDTISTSTWEATGATIDSSSNTTTTATAVVSGASDGAELTNTIVTAAGLKKQRTIRVYEVTE